MNKFQSVGRKLKNLRMAKGWTQSDAAEVVGVSRLTISQIELGKKKRGNALLAYMAVLGVPIERLFS